MKREQARQALDRDGASGSPLAVGRAVLPCRGSGRPAFRAISHGRLKAFLNTQTPSWVSSGPTLRTSAWQ